MCWRDGWLVLINTDVSGLVASIGSHDVSMSGSYGVSLKRLLKHFRRPVTLSLRIKKSESN